MTWLPTTSVGIAHWTLVLAALYVAARMAISKAVRRKEVGFGLLGDALTFAASSVLLLGVWYPAVLKAIGDTTSYLIIASLAGLYYSVQSALPGQRAA